MRVNNNDFASLRLVRDSFVFHPLNNFFLSECVIFFDPQTIYLDPVPLSVGGGGGGGCHEPLGPNRGRWCRSWTPSRSSRARTVSTPSEATGGGMRGAILRRVLSTWLVTVG